MTIYIVSHTHMHIEWTVYGLTGFQQNAGDATIPMREVCLLYDGRTADKADT